VNYETDDDTACISNAHQKSPLRWFQLKPCLSACALAFAASQEIEYRSPVIGSRCVSKSKSLKEISSGAGRGGRAIAAIFAHVHNVRSKWLRLSAPHLKLPARLDRARSMQEKASAALAESAARCCEMLAEALTAPQDRGQNFLPARDMGMGEAVDGVWLQTPVDQKETPACKPGVKNLLSLRN